MQQLQSTVSRCLASTYYEEHELLKAKKLSINVYFYQNLSYKDCLVGLISVSRLPSPDLSPKTSPSLLEDKVFDLSPYTF